MIGRESLREIAIGKFIVKKQIEVGVDKIDEKEIKAYENGFLDCYDRFFVKEDSVKIPLYHVDSANFKLPESKL